MLIENCQMCGCPCEPTKHHLIPVSRTRNRYKDIRDDDSNHIWICRSCHDFLHANFDNTELRDRLNTLDAIINDEKCNRFISWKKKHPDFKGHAKMSRDQRNMHKNR